MINKKTMCSILLYTLVVSVLFGCGKTEQSEEKQVFVSVTDYQRNSYQTVKVKRGTIEPVLTLKLKPDAFENKNYSIKQELLEVEELYVERGMQVKAGDIMVSFKADDVRKNIEEYEKRRAEAEMLIEHYKKLMAISAEPDYSTDIKKLENDLNVDALYIAEQKARLSQYQIVAEQDGTVTEVNDDLYSGYAVGGKTLIRVASGSSNYTASTTDDYDFQVGDRYTAKLNLAEYEFEVIEVNREDRKTTLIFAPVSDMMGVLDSDELTMTIEKEAISNAVYVEEKAIRNVDKVPFAYRLDENGFREVVLVTVGETIDGYRIIRNGLKEGEQVVIN